MKADTALHDAFWQQMQPAVSDATRAIGDARDLAEAVLNEDVTPELRRTIAEHWLERHGRNVLRSGADEVAAVHAIDDELARRGQP